MNTSTIIVEILVIGILTSLWFLPILGSINFNAFFSKSISENYLSFISIALSYVLGMVINQISHVIVFPINKVFHLDIDKDKIRKIRTKNIVDSNDGFIEYLNFRRSIVRIFRSSIFNIIIIILFYSFNFFEFQKLTNNKFDIFFFSVLLISFLAIVYSYVKTSKGYNQFVIDSGDIND
jgi:hypothetical protein